MNSILKCKDTNKIYILGMKKEKFQFLHWNFSVLSYLNNKTWLIINYLKIKILVFGHILVTQPQFLLFLTII
jgi:hypothetical protein